ncbi:dihydroorotate oxidase [Ophiostoma piceae UAMH 11346]|uniref:Dihydroorotate dehydrogenase (fumarate) n=1 Tax=Ophiostoma piceae (strain UAMH 11346) TaxID=1262450 RepID=S3CYH8_OPHP1|nr:dihydroorotate oxidase [Ophiostoma piceae UAMH 11346]
MAPQPLVIDPPLLNTANPWATDLADLSRLYACPHTGAVTTRTSLLAGFAHNPAIHQFTFFDAAAHDPQNRSKEQTGSLNNLGYSPLTLDTYLGFIKTIAATHASPTGKPKGFLVSVTGSPADVAGCYAAIAALQAQLPHVPLSMEVNLSCPNIPNKPPPAYNGASLLEYLDAIHTAVSSSSQKLPVGFKTPPYTHAGQFDVLVGALRRSAAATGVCPLSFLTATNTLGSSLVMTFKETGHTAALPNGGIGGMAGAPLHPLALGNVATLRRMLDADEDKAKLGHIRIIGAGGVSDAAGYGRMKQVGSYAVGVGTGLGVYGVDVFGKILTASARL